MRTSVDSTQLALKLIEACKQEGRGRYDERIQANYEGVSRGFVALINNGITFQENKELYLAVIESSSPHAGDNGLDEVFKMFTFNKDLKDLYFAIIRNVWFVSAAQLLKLFKILSDAGITVEENKAFYLDAIIKGAHADKLEVAFQTFKKFNIELKGNEDLYQAAIHYPYNSVMLDTAFQMLSTHGIAKDNKFFYLAAVQNSYNLVEAFQFLNEKKIALAGHEEMYLAVTNHASHIRNLPKTFEILAEAGITFKENKELYLAAIENFYAKKLDPAFKSLKKAGILLEEKNKGLFLEVINNAEYADKLDAAFQTLFHHNITFQHNKVLYESIIKKAFCADKLAKAFLIFAIEAKLNIPNLMELYSNVITHTDCIDKLLQVLSTYRILGIFKTPEKYADYFKPHTLLTNVTLTKYVLHKLTSEGYSLTLHEVFFSKLLDMLSRNDMLDYIIVDIVNKACAYAKANPIVLDGVDKDALKALEKIVDVSTTQFDDLTSGPLDKSDSTQQIEILLEKFCDPTCELEDCLYFKYPNDYILTLPGESPVNLSLLIKNANLSQLTLSETIIEKLGAVLNNIMIIPFNVLVNANEIVRLLPKVEQMAIDLYAGMGYHYKNINKLLRAEILHALKTGPLCSNKSDDRLAYFILGCLINDALNKIEHLVNLQPEKQLMDKIALKYDIEISDILTNESEFESKLRESKKDKVINENDFNLLMNSLKKLRYYYPSKNIRLVRGEEGLSCTEEEGLAYTTEEKQRITNPWVLPSFTSFSAHKEGVEEFLKEGDFTRMDLQVSRSYIIRDREREVGFPQGTQVFTTKQIALEKKLISRIVRSPSLDSDDHYRSDMALHSAIPDINLPETYRVMLATQYVVQYFANYAKDLEFQRFCRSLTKPEEIDLEWLRIASVACNLFGSDDREYLMAFMNEIDPKASQNTKERMLYIVSHMGDPQFEDNNQDPNIDERNIRNYYHRILSMAQTLDLSCSDSLQPYVVLSEKSVAQKQAMDELIQYIDALKQAHQSFYERKQDDWKWVFDISETVKKPKKILPFQYGKLNDPFYVETKSYSVEEKGSTVSVKKQLGLTTEALHLKVDQSVDPTNSPSTTQKSTSKNVFDKKTGKTDHSSKKIGCSTFIKKIVKKQFKFKPRKL